MKFLEIMMLIRTLFFLYTSNCSITEIYPFNSIIVLLEIDLRGVFDNCPEKKGKESTFQETGTDPTYVQINSTVILRTYK